jgi:hypothetical protein
MTAKTDFRKTDRLQWAQDIKIDEQAHQIHDRIQAKRNKLGFSGSFTPEEMGYTQYQWSKLSKSEKENARDLTCNKYRLSLLTDEELFAECAIARSFFRGL